MHGACRAELCLRSALRSKTIWKAIDDTKVRSPLLYDTARAHSMCHSRHWRTPHVAFVRHPECATRVVGAAAWKPAAISRSHRTGHSHCTMWPHSDAAGAAGLQVTIDRSALEALFSATQQTTARQIDGDDAGAGGAKTRKKNAVLSVLDAQV